MVSGEKNKDELYSCHAENEKKRCPVCGSLRTKKNGFVESKILSARGSVKREIRRHLCKECGKSFTEQGYNSRKRITDDLKRTVVEDFVLTKSSSSEVGRRYGVSKTSVINWTKELAVQYSILEEIDDNVPWSGWITIDGQEIKVKGKKKVILAAIDAVIMKPICYIIAEAENKDASEIFLKKLKKVYPVKTYGITSDFGRSKCFVGVIAEVFPNVPHQICLFHFKRYVRLGLPKTKKSRYYWRNRVMKEMIKRILDADDREISLYWYERFMAMKPFFKASYHHRFIRSVERNYQLLTKHYEVSGMPKTSNTSENLCRQLKRKLKNLDGFKSEVSLYAFLRIWFACYRLK